MTSLRSKEFRRLPGSTVPLHYDIHLRPNLENFTFDGDVTINIKVLEDTTALEFHMKSLDLEKSIFEYNQKEFENLPLSFDKAWDYVELSLPDVIKKGTNAVLRLKFKGELKDTMQGFYRSKYADQNGTEKFLATTQFDSCDARSAFPCWDEPAYKATIALTLTVPGDKTALSCTNQKKETVNSDGTKTIEFNDSPLMSTSLLAFAVGEFEYIEGKTNSGVTVRVYTIPGKSEQGRFALEVALKAIPFYEEYFGIPFVLPKCDLIAIPDFDLGAMENWGLITYREICLLVDPSVSSLAVKQRVARIVSHEISHMWFGNLATMEWWSDVWLKEGYATFMEYYLVNKLFPEYDIMTQFVGGKTLNGLFLDSLKNSHPIEVPIEDPNQIMANYDVISYDKSGSILRMLHAFLGDELYSKCSSCYLKKYAYACAKTQDLWDVFSAQSGQDVGSLMRNWTQCMGYPLITVSSSQKGSDAILQLEQRKFFADGSTDKHGILWHVPVNIVTNRKPDIPVVVLLTEKNMEVCLAETSTSDWVKVYNVMRFDI